MLHRSSYLPPDSDTKADQMRSDHRILPFFTVSKTSVIATKSFSAWSCILPPLSYLSPHPIPYIGIGNRIPLSINHSSSIDRVSMTARTGLDGKLLFLAHCYCVRYYLFSMRHSNSTFVSLTIFFVVVLIITEVASDSSSKRTNVYGVIG